MNRRSLIVASSMAMLMPSLALSAGGYKHVEYTPDAYAKALASGKPLLLDFFAPW